MTLMLIHTLSWEHECILLYEEVEWWIWRQCENRHWIIQNKMWGKDQVFFGEKVSFSAGTLDSLVSIFKKM